MHQVSKSELAARRAAEMRAAAAALGHTVTPVLLGYEDGALENTYEVRLRVTALIRIHRPTLLITFSPSRDYGGYQRGSEHRDHRAAGDIALDCFYPLARDHLQAPSPRPLRNERSTTHWIWARPLVSTPLSLRDPSYDPPLAIAVRRAVAAMALPRLPRLVRRA